FIWTELPPCLVNNAHLVTGHRLPGRPIADVAWPVAQKGLQHFGRAEAIKHVDPDSIAPTLADMGGQRLACRHADAQPVGASATANVPMRKESGIELWYAVKNRGTMATHDFKNALRARTMRP